MKKIDFDPSKHVRNIAGRDLPFERATTCFARLEKIYQAQAGTAAADPIEGCDQRCQKSALLL